MISRKSFVLYVVTGTTAFWSVDSVSCMLGIPWEEYQSIELRRAFRYWLFSVFTWFLWVGFVFRYTEYGKSDLGGGIVLLLPLVFHPQWFMHPELSPSCGININSYSLAILVVELLFLLIYIVDNFIRSLGRGV